MENIEEPKQETLEEELKFKNRQIGAAGFVANKIMENMISKPKQETLEEAAERLAYDSTEENKGFPKIKAFKDGAKWQAERMYSKEDVIAIVEKSRATGLTAEYLIEQFKKK